MRGSGPCDPGSNPGGANTKMNPKVLVGCPTNKKYSYCLGRFLRRVKSLSYDNYDVIMVDHSEDDTYFKKIHKKRTAVIKIKPEETEEKSKAKARNILRKLTLHTYDYFLSLEQDIIPPKNVIQTLLKHNRNIISGVYFNPTRDGNIVPVAYTWLKQSEFNDILANPMKYPDIAFKIKQKGIKSADELRKQLSFEDVETNRLMEIKYVGLGCILIKKDVLKKLMFKTISEGKTRLGNVIFCEDARKLGQKVWLYTGVRCKHILPKK